MRKWPGEYLAIDFVNERIYKPKKSKRKDIIRPDAPAATAHAGNHSEQQEDHDFLDEIPQVVDDVELNSGTSSSLTQAEEYSVKKPPRSPFTDSMSPERKRYYEDLEGIRQEWLAECESDGLYQRAGAGAWQDYQIRAWLYVLRDETPAEKLESQYNRWVNFASKMLALYGVDKTNIQCRYQASSRKCEQERFRTAGEHLKELLVCEFVYSLSKMSFIQ